jgi:hypothetical protein
MKATDLILALFFSDESNLVFNNIKLSKNIPEDVSDFTKDQLKTLSLRFLGPLFLTTKIEASKGWKIDLIEASLSQYQDRTRDVDVIQAFFIVNSSIESDKGITHLFTCIGSPYTENIKIIYDLISEYIHPNIIQGKIVNESLLGNKFEFEKYINNELQRGVDVINYFLGSARKIYWEEQLKYNCIGFIERKIPISSNTDEKVSNLYTFDVNDSLREEALKNLPSFYIMAILPDYYENRILETLKVFDKTSVYPNIRMMRLSNREKKVIYMEEYIIDNGVKRSYGVILVPEKEKNEENKDMSFYKKQLRFILDKNANMEKVIITINSKINPFEKWDTINEVGLEKMEKDLDNKWNKNI